MAEKKAKTYVELSDELAAIISWFEAGNVDLDEAIIKYEAASKLIDKLETYLKNAENKIERISLQDT